MGTDSGAAPLAERLRARGLRLTAQRQRVLEAVAAAQALVEGGHHRFVRVDGPGAAALPDDHPTRCLLSRHGHHPAVPAI